MSFPKEISRCRTFCFLHEVEMLYDQNLIQGGTFDNAIVIVEKDINEAQKEKLQKIFGMPEVKVQEGTLNNLELQVTKMSLLAINFSTYWRLGFGRSSA